MGTEYRKQAHCTYHVRYHLVFVTKYRRKVLRSGLGRYLLFALGDVQRRYPDVDVLKAEVDEDHVHLLAVVPPRMAVSDAVRMLKSLTARMMLKKFPFLRTMYERSDLGLWSDGYFVSTVGADEETVRRYIENQGKEDGGQTKFEW